MERHSDDLHEIWESLSQLRGLQPEYPTLMPGMNWIPGSLSTIYKRSNKWYNSYAIKLRNNYAESEEITMKEIYVNAEMELVIFPVEDVISTSGIPNDNDDLRGEGEFSP